VCAKSYRLTIEQFFSHDTITTLPWKNGGGVTREVAKSHSRAPFWRLSIANVDQEGLFSSFEGLDRILTVIEGKGMVLARYNGDLIADLYNPVHFSETEAIDGLLPNGPIQDFNLIFDGSKLAADVSVTDTVELDISLSSTLVMTLVYCLTGAFKTALGDALRKFDHSGFVMAYDLTTINMLATLNHVPSCGPNICHRRVICCKA